jgi:hypothetical protein
MDEAVEEGGPTHEWEKLVAVEKGERIETVRGFWQPCLFIVNRVQYDIHRS